MQPGTFHRAYWFYRLLHQISFPFTPGGHGCRQLCVDHFKLASRQLYVPAASDRSSPSRRRDSITSPGVSASRRRARKSRIGTTTSSSTGSFAKGARNWGRRQWMRWSHLACRKVTGRETARLEWIKRCGVLPSFGVEPRIRNLYRWYTEVSCVSVGFRWG